MEFTPILLWTELRKRLNMRSRLYAHLILLSKELNFKGNTLVIIIKREKNWKRVSFMRKQPANKNQLHFLCCLLALDVYMLFVRNE